LINANQSSSMRWSKIALLMATPVLKSLSAES
jgi:hypothetical protein